MRLLQINIICICLLMLSVISGNGWVVAQNATGIVTDNYSGVNRSWINPAAVADSPFCLHFNIITLHGGIQNNYLFIPRGELGLNFINNWQDIFFRNPRQYMQKRDWIPYLKGNQYLRMQGPSISLQYRDHTFFMLTSVRMGMSVTRVPSHVINFAARSGLFFLQQQNIIFSESRVANMATASWAEIGLGYAYNITDNNLSRVALGFTLRPMLGLHGGTFHVDNLTYRVNDLQELHLMNFNARFQGSLPINYATQDWSLRENIIKGRGLSFDAGLTYTRFKDYRNSRRTHSTRDDYKREDYHYRVGFSIMDIGFLTFRKNTLQTEINELKGLWSDLDWINIDNVSRALYDFDAVFPEGMVYSGEVEITEGEPFSMYLPTMASLQIDYNLGNNFFAYLLFVQDIPYARTKIKSPSYAGFIPRYETRKFTVAIPFTLYEYQKPRIGISIRYGFFTIGSEQPGGMLNLNDFDGADFYFSINWGLDNCKRKRHKSSPCFFH